MRLNNTTTLYYFAKTLYYFAKFGVLCPSLRSPQAEGLCPPTTPLAGSVRTPPAPRREYVHFLFLDRQEYYSEAYKPSGVLGGRQPPIHRPPKAQTFRNYSVNRHDWQGPL